MKKEIKHILFLALALIFTANAISAQESGKEKKVEKKITIVTVDENGVRTETDTVFTETAGAKKIFVTESGDKMVWTMAKDSAMTGKEKTFSFIVKEGDGTYMISGTDSLKWIEEDIDMDHRHIISKHDALGEGETEIVIRSADGVENFRIKGDAVITIKDGSVKVENRSSGLKEVGEEKQVKKVNKK